MCKTCEVFYDDIPCPSSQGRGAWSHNAVILKDNPGKKFRRHDNSEIHKKAMLMKTQARIQEGLSRADKKTKAEKENTNELYIAKLIKIVHFLARNNLPVKELYPKVIAFLAEEIEEPVIKQYLKSAARNSTYESSDSCDSLLVAIDTCLRNNIDRRLKGAADIVLFADEATSVARKEMMGVFLSYFDEETKSPNVEFVSLVSVSSTKSEVLIEKMKSILKEREIDIIKTRFICFDGTNSMSGVHHGVQRRYKNDAPFAIYVNCRCHRLALCFKHLMQDFPWLQKIDKLLLGLWKAFHYSSLNRHIFKTLQEAYGMKALNLVKAAVTRWLSHGSACRRCRERYHEIVAALDDILVKNKNPEWIGYRSTLLQESTIYEITFLEDVLSVTNSLCLLLQSDRKDFGAISRVVQTTITTLKDMCDNENSIFFKSFKGSVDIIKRLSNSEMRHTVSGGTRKRARLEIIDVENPTSHFHSKVIQPFISALINEISSAFDLSDLPVLNSFLVLDPVSIPEINSSEFNSHGIDQLRTLHHFYATDATDTYEGRTTRCEKLLPCTFQQLEAEFSGYKNYVVNQRQNIKSEMCIKETALTSRLKCLNADKYSTKKAISKVESEINFVRTKIMEPINAEDMLKDSVLEHAFPQIRRLLLLYVLIPHTEAIVERGFSRMGQIMTKKRSTLDDNSLDLLMRISYRKKPFDVVEINQIFDSWKGMKERRIFNDI